VRVITPQEFVGATWRFPRPSAVVKRRFEEVFGNWEHGAINALLLSPERTVALVDREATVAEIAKEMHFERVEWVGRWQLNGNFVRRKRFKREYIKVGDGYYSPKLLVGVARVLGRELSFYKAEGASPLFVVNEEGCCVIAPRVEPNPEEVGCYELRDVAKELAVAIKAPSESFLDQLSEGEALELIERLSRELGILHM